MKIFQKIAAKISKDQILSNFYDSSIINNDEFFITNYNINNNIIIFFPDAHEKIELALGLTDAGYQVCGTFSCEINGKNLPQEILWYEVNDENSLLKSVNFIKEKRGKIDVLLFNNLKYDESKILKSPSMKDFKNYFYDDLLSTYKIVNAILPLMLEQKKGKIISLNSTLFAQNLSKINQSAKLSYFEYLMLDGKDNIDIFFIDCLSHSSKNPTILRKIIQIIRSKEKKFYIPIGFDLKFMLLLKVILPRKTFHEILKKKFL